MKRLNYSKRTVPTNYKCCECGKTNIKLWREYMTANPSLYCCECAAKKKGEDIHDIGKDGRHTSEYGETDKIGDYVPAVPIQEGDGYWGYTSVPYEGVKWWKRLPTKP